MKVTFLGQGFESSSKNAVGHSLIRNFKDAQFHTFIGISAFTSLSGVNGLSKHINSANHLKVKSFITGVDQKGTSKEALQALLRLKINAYIFYQPSTSIFHPKIYVFEGDNSSSVIIGSSNLTALGLFSNVESSFMIELDNNKAEDKSLLDDIKAYFKGLFEYSDPNLQPLTQRLIDEMVKAAVVPTEAQRKATQDKQPLPGRNLTTIGFIFPKRPLAKIPAEFRSNQIPKLNRDAAKRRKKASPYGSLIWTRRKLPASSVQLSPGGNPTGGLRLVQDKFVVAGQVIDQTSYFRYNIFSAAKWRTIKTNPLVEVAQVNFDVTIRGVYIGNFDLEVRHKPSGDAGQNNYTTSISWGAIGNAVRKSELTGARLDLYSPAAGSSTFNIAIL
jgi:HKD family nuclease